MERYVFIHGSSVGQSAFVPIGAPEAVCNDIAAKYFQGRTLRQKESAAGKALFVELYGSSQGIWSVYSFVNNVCLGANGRDGQYFAISILCNGTYVYPESIYDMLAAAYETMFKNGRILKNAENGQSQYVISQFSEQKEYLTAFLKKIEEVFDKVSAGEGKSLGDNVSTADYDSWRGYKVSLDTCNSISVFKELTGFGRLYVSGEYESASAMISALRSQVSKLQVEKAEIENMHIEATRSQKSREFDKIEDLNSQIRQKDIEIASLQKENAGYEAAIGAVRKELDRYAKVSKAVIDLQDKKTQCQSKRWQDMLKWLLLVLILLFTLLNALASFGFFRDGPTSGEGGQTSGETESTVTGSTAVNDNPNPEAFSLDVIPSELDFTSGGETKILSIFTDGEWEMDNLSEWIVCTKDENNVRTLKVKADTNHSTKNRQCEIVIRSGQIEKKVSIRQAAAASSSSRSNILPYEFIVTDNNGRILKEGDEVTKGQRIHVTVQGRNPGAGYGWVYVGCSGDNDGKNTESVEITINGRRNSNEVVFSYGKLNDYSKRKKYTLIIKKSTGGANVAAASVKETEATGETVSPGEKGYEGDGDSSIEQPVGEDPESMSGADGLAEDHPAASDSSGVTVSPN